jgi:hypothetical protein
MAFDLLGIKKIAETVQRDFPPEFLLRAGAAQVKKWFLEELAKATDTFAIMERLNSGPRAPETLPYDIEETRRILGVIWTYFREKL